MGCHQAPQLATAPCERCRNVVRFEHYVSWGISNMFKFMLVSADIVSPYCLRWKVKITTFSASVRSVCTYDSLCLWMFVFIVTNQNFRRIIKIVFVDLNTYQYLAQAWPIRHRILRSSDHESCTPNSFYSFARIFLKFSDFCFRDLKMVIFYQGPAEVFIWVKALSLFW